MSIESVIKKIEAQQKGKENTAVFMVGEQLKDICKESQAVAELVNNDLDVPEMSIVHAEKKIKEYADKQSKSGNCVCVAPNVADGIIRKFYGISEKEKKQESNAPSIDISKSFSLLDLI